MQQITITRPDDWHLHLRDHEILATVLPHSARRFARAIVMPNLSPPVTTTAQAQAYRQRILAALPRGMEFEPLMTLFLTDATSPAEIERAAASDCVTAVKLYPAGVTTHSEAGVRSIEATWPALEAMEETGLPLLVHGEVSDPEVDVFDREARFIDTVLVPLRDRFPQLKMVFEHVSTREAVQFVQAAPQGLGATVTPQHMLLNRNAMLAAGLNPHHYCMPVLKREQHREAVVEAATGADRRFFLGTDSAPHARGAKESACGCAGIFSAHAGIELYAEAFHDAGRLDALEAFASFHGPDFYGLPRNTTTLTLARVPWTPPERYPLGDDGLVPFRAGEAVAWSVTGEGPAEGDE